MKRIVTQLCTIALLCASSAVASASIVYNYDRSAGVFGGNSGLSYNGVSASYNTHSDEFTFSVDYNGTAAEGGWLVISPGPNPKNSITELGIAYFEASTGRTWVYGTAAAVLGSNALSTRIVCHVFQYHYPRPSRTRSPPRFILTIPDGDPLIEGRHAPEPREATDAEAMSRQTTVVSCGSTDRKAFSFRRKEPNG
ncbi:MAG: hypothetical protein AAF465_15740, partial [Pseudomonadota bacterium]